MDHLPDGVVPLMTESVIFVPERRGVAPDDIAYVERASRNRSLHLLFHDRSPASPHSSLRKQFLSRSFRSLVSRFQAVGRIEHPRVLLRESLQEMDRLSRAPETRIEDASGLDVIVLVQDGATFHVLATAASMVRFRRGSGEWRMPGDPSSGARDEPISTEPGQTELFTGGIASAMSWSRVDPVPDGGAIAFLLGGTEATQDALIDATSVSGALGQTHDGGNVPTPLVDRRVLLCRFDPVRVQRMPIDAERPQRLRIDTRTRRILAAAGVMVLVSGTGVWTAQRFVETEVRGGATPVVTTATPSGEVPAATGAQQASPRLRSRATAEQSLPASTSDPMVLEQAWTLQQSQPVTSSPLVADDLVIYGCRDGYVYAVDAASGVERWKYRAADGVGSSPIRAHRNVIAADYAGNVFAVRVADGKPAWKQPLGSRIVSTAAVGGGQVVVGTMEGTVYGLSLETGRVLWKVAAGGRVRGSITFGAERFFVPSYDGHLYAILPGGRTAWKQNTGAQIGASPAVSDGGVAVANEAGDIFLFDAADGRLRWKRETGIPVRSSLAISAGALLIGTSNHYLVCLNMEDGAERWRFSAAGPVLSRPLVIDDRVLVTSYDNRLYCIDLADGRELARFDSGGEVYSSPATDNQRIFFGNNKGRIIGVTYRSAETM